jgi:predicted ATP-grasp superfamily ATP-dependent carboligase
LYGVDFIVDEAGAPWVTEVNPRYPASLELLEHATGCPLLGDHCRCFATEDVPTSAWKHPHPGEFLAKGVLYSPAPLTLRQALADAGSVPAFDLPEIADLPAPGSVLRRGDPVCTVYAHAETADGAWQLLQTKLAETNQLLAARSAAAPKG